jgi:hypothetical protein
MLQAVLCHPKKIVHYLKSAIFVLVLRVGQLKFIDFETAYAIVNDTTIIQRDHQKIGSVHYMTLEAIELLDGKQRLKKPVDPPMFGLLN